ncbi:MAG: hypothetical protein AB7I29_09180 [Geobacter sp.]
MNNELKELISKADKGDSGAQRELMDCGDSAAAAGDHEQAAHLYKMAAMAYRIAVSRTNGTLADTAHTCARFARTIKLYDDWIRTYTRPRAPRINALKRRKLASEASSCILQLRRDKEYAPLVRYLEEKLDEHGIHFCAPGGTINRHFYYMATQREDFLEFMHDIDLRVALDPLSDKILKMIEKETRTAE